MYNITMLFLPRSSRWWDGVVLPSNAKIKFISFAQGPTVCFFA